MTTTHPTWGARLVEVQRRKLVEHRPNISPEDLLGRLESFAMSLGRPMRFDVLRFDAFDSLRPLCREVISRRAARLGVTVNHNIVALNSRDEFVLLRYPDALDDSILELWEAEAMLSFDEDRAAA